MRNYRIAALILASFIAFVPVAGARADTPPRKPKRVVIWSKNKEFFVVSDPRRWTITAYRRLTTGKTIEQWEMYGWFHQGNLANDGHHLVITPNRGTVVPRDRPAEEPVLYFIKSGILLKVLLVKDVLPDIFKLKRTVSGYYWGHCVGLDRADQFILDTVDGRRLHIDITSGKIVKVGRPPE